MKHLLSLILLTLALKAPATILSKEATISILTCSPGDEMYSLFGHTGIRISDPTFHIDVVFNYGTFDFDTQGFYFKFARGLLPYQLTYSPFLYFKASYEREQRSIYSQTLLIDSIQKQRFMDLLEENYRPENRSYLYNFLYDNCSTRVRDIIEKSLDGQVEWRTREKNKSFWNLLDEYMNTSPWIQWGIHTILGSPANADATIREEMFLPDYFMFALDSAYHANKRLAAPIEVIYQAPIRKGSTPWYLSPGFMFLVCALLLTALLQRFKERRFLQSVAFPFFLASGLIGCLLIFLGYFTAHPTTAPNFNLIWANPLNLPVAFWLFKKHLSWLIRKYLTLYLYVLIIGFASWFLLTPAVLYSSLIIIAWMAYLTYRLQKQ